MHQLYRNRRSLIFYCFSVLTLIILFAVYYKVIILDQRYKALLLCSIPMVYLLVQNLSEKLKFVLFIISALTVSFQMPVTRTYTFSPSELIIFFLALDVGVKNKYGLMILFKRKYLPYTLFMLGGFATAAFSGGTFTFWYSVCVVPFLLKISIESMLHKYDALRILNAVLIGIIIYLAIMWLSNKLGTATNYWESDISSWRLGSQYIVLGPIKFVSWATRLGSLMAIGLPLVTILSLQNKISILLRILYITTFLLFSVTLISTASRGASIAALFGIMVSLIASRKILSIKAILSGVILVMLILSMGDFLGNIFYKNIERLSTLKYGITTIYNYQYRIDALKFTVEGILKNPIGYGHGYLWNKYGIDEVIAYSMLLNGTGLIGFMGFALMIGQLFGHFSKFTFFGRGKEQNNIIAIGFGTLAAGLVSGLASESFMVSVVHSFVFWTIMAVCSSNALPSKALPHR